MGSMGNDIAATSEGRLWLFSLVARASSHAPFPRLLQLAAQKQSASFNLALHDLAADNFDRTRRRQDTSVEKEMDQVMGLLKGLEIKRMEEEKKQVQEFDKRNKALWDVSWLENAL
jgi:hypothetical protein